jgi:hypothetical protein
MQALAVRPDKVAASKAAIIILFSFIRVIWRLI